MYEYDFSKLKGLTIGVAVSGGKDSMCLLDIIANTSREVGFDFVVINVEHGIRGKASTRDSEFVRSYSISCGYEIMSFSVDSLGYARANGVSVEQAARILRYQCFDSLLSSAAVDRILTAHHAADQTETILLRIARGTGIAGLGGITEQRNGYIRPLLSVTKEYLDEYAAVHNVPYVTDETNFEDEYNRNYMRLKVVPAIKARYPELDRAVFRLTRDATAADKYITKTALNYVYLGDPYFGMQKCLDCPSALRSAYPGYFSAEFNTRPTFFDSVSLPIILAEQDEIIALRALAAAFKFMGVFQDVEYRHLKIALSSFEKQNGYFVNMPFSVVLYKEYSYVVLQRAKEKDDFVLPVKKDIDLISGEKVFSVMPASDTDRIKFDFSAIPQNAVIRTRKQGDVFTTFSGHTLSLGDWFTDNKVPARVRDFIPVLAIDNTILAIADKEICPTLKITRETMPENIYTIKYKGVTND